MSRPAPKKSALSGSPLTPPTQSAPPAAAAPEPAPDAAAPASAAAGSAPARKRAGGRPKRATVARTTAAPPAAKPAATGARWAELEAKTTRLRPDQRRDLTDLARRLTRAKAGAGERITDNTLIRVAVDMLLSQQDSLAGTTTEEEMRLKFGLDQIPTS